MDRRFQSPARFEYTDSGIEAIPPETLNDIQERLPRPSGDEIRNGEEDTMNRFVRYIGNVC